MVFVFCKFCYLGGGFICIHVAGMQLDHCHQTLLGLQGGVQSVHVLYRQHFILRKPFFVCFARDQKLGNTVYAGYALSTVVKAHVHPCKAVQNTMIVSAATYPAAHKAILHADCKHMVILPCCQQCSMNKSQGKILYTVMLNRMRDNVYGQCSFPGYCEEFICVRQVSINSKSGRLWGSPRWKIATKPATASAEQWRLHCANDFVSRS